ncbi:hypothetical protein [Catenuloplanes atrovinosus]|uniref:Uncharacterized protein n=1 Tax=Catenuloplanes atrovinosus TaxID=137266 RepID=A0AAE3YGS5_9ACTN|nr:hypothetical protein [Catenuloplanes atrovinosus]MDR7273394.1 hypothetical protein [Catenuloplanes atrovinosus]
MTITATRPTPAPATTSAPAVTVVEPTPVRVVDDAREQARRALQVSLDTRQ